MHAFTVLSAGFSLVTALPQASVDGSNPQIQLDFGTFKGTTRYQGVDSYLGIPFAKAGRFENPEVISAADKVQGVQDATEYGLSCPQQELIASPVSANNAQIGSLLSTIEEIGFAPISHQGENCLSINVQVPQGVNSTAGLPILFWIHGGGFELGSSAALASESTAVQGVPYQGAHLVQRSVEMGQPIIFVSANHRLNAFGAMSSQELNDAGVPNLLLKDQRTAMQWIQNYIEKFGGDKSRVTLFGESAGSLAIATHMVLNDGNPDGLFSSAIMASGGIMRLKDYRTGQNIFDQVSKACGCETTTDKLDCLRKVDYNKIYNAVQQIPNFFSYTSTAVPWYPRPDGKYLTDSPHKLLRSGKVADIPFIIGDMKDEGTLFSLVPQLNMTTDKDMTLFWKQNFWPNLSDEQIQEYTKFFPEDPAAGSPFDTGLLNEVGPQYKRLAAAVGDFTFQQGRRALLAGTHENKPKYTYLQEQSLYLLGQVPALSGVSGLPALGSFHASDVILNTFGLIPASVSKNTLNVMSTYIAFVNSHNPNNHGLKDLPEWPEWDASGRGMFQFAEDGCTVIKDDYRDEEMSFMNEHADTYMH